MSKSSVGIPGGEKFISMCEHGGGVFVCTDKNVYMVQHIINHETGRDVPTLVPLRIEYEES
jgi:hypothetical protein